MNHAAYDDVLGSFVLMTSGAVLKTPDVCDCSCVLKTSAVFGHSCVLSSCVLGSRDRK
jgi:hypothetical protein